MSQNSQQTKMTFGIKEANDFRIELSKIKSEAELNKLYDEYIAKADNYTISFEQIGNDTITHILSFFEHMTNVPFNVTAPLVSCYEKLKSDLEDTLANKKSDAIIDYSQIKVIQTMLVQASWDANPDAENPLEEGKRLLAALKALEPANIALSKIEKKTQFIGARIAELEQEELTGLKRKPAAEDDETRLIKAVEDDLAKENAEATKS